eukprot:641859-Lingulodinium_polyedra.AAC.1
MFGPSARVIRFLVGVLAPATQLRYEEAAQAFFEWDTATASRWELRAEEEQDFILCEYLLDLRDRQEGVQAGS